MCEARLEGWLTMSQAARILGCSPDLVRYMVRRGRLSALWTPLGRLVREDEILDLASESDGGRSDLRD